MICPLNFTEDLATLSGRLKKKLWYASVIIMTGIVTCKLLIIRNLIFTFSQLVQKLSFDGNDFSSSASSQYHHRFGGLANYKGSALTTGSFSSSSSYVRTELFDFNLSQWTNMQDFPFTS